LTGAAILSGVVGRFRIRNLEEKRPILIKPLQCTWVICRFHPLYELWLMLWEEN